MTKEQEEAIETMKHWIDFEKHNRDKINKADDLIKIQETVLNMLKEKDSEIERLEQTLAKNIARNVTASMKESAKSKEDLEMLNQGWQIELEKKDKQIDLMAKELYIQGFCKKMNCNECTEEFKTCIKQYFERKSEE